MPHPSVYKTCGALGRLIIARHKRVIGRDPIDHDSTEPAHAAPPLQDHPLEDFFAHRLDEDPFPNADLLYLDEQLKGETKRNDLENMIQRYIDNDIAQRFVQTLGELVWEFKSTFSMQFSRTMWTVDPLNIMLTPDARPVKVQLRIYSPSHQAFMKKMMDEHIHQGIMYHNTASIFSALHILPEQP